MINSPHDITLEAGEDLMQRILARAVPGKNGCIEWKGQKQHGYGILTYKTQAYKAHRLIGLLHVPGWFEGAIIRHLCNNPGCINDDHLKWGTRGENNLDTIAAGRKTTYTYGEISGTHKLKEYQVEEIRALLKKGELQRVIAKRYGVTQMHISRIKNGRRRKHAAPTY